MSRVMPTGASFCASKPRAHPASSRSVHISACAAAVPCSIGRSRIIERGNAAWSWKRCGKRASIRRSPTSSMRTAMVAGAPYSTPAAAPKRCSKSALRRGALTVSSPLIARSGAKAVLEVGFAAARTHRIVAIDRCPVLAPDLSRAVAVAWALAEALGPTKKPLDIAVTATDAGLDVDVRGSGPLAPALMTELARLATKHGLARLTRQGEWVGPSRPPTLRVGKAIVSLPPATFLQATAAGEAALARLALTACADAAKVADLFCGIGAFALRLCR